MIVCEGKRSDVCVREGRRREGRAGERAESGGTAAKKLEPHTEMWGKTSCFTVFRGCRRTRLSSNRAPVVSVMRAARTGLIDISWVLGTEVA